MPSSSAKACHRPSTSTLSTWSGSLWFGSLLALSLSDFMRIPRPPRGLRGTPDWKSPPAYADAALCWQQLRPAIAPSTGMVLCDDGSYLTDPRDVDAALWARWNTWWRRDFARQPVPKLDSWLDRLPVPSPCPPLDLTVNAFRSSLKKMKPSTAVYADGWRPMEMLMLPDDFIQLFCVLFTNWETKGTFPRLLQGCTITMIPKPEVMQPKLSDFRPISVYSVAWRAASSSRAAVLLAWLASFAPEGLRGGLRDHEVAENFLSIALQLEQADLDGQVLSGGTADLEKMFDAIPRAAVMEICRRWGVPGPFLRSWMAWLDGTERRLKLGQTLGEAHLTTTGFPQGCALSVFASLTLTVLLHAAFDDAGLDVKLASWIDNLSWTTLVPQQVPEAFDIVNEFANDFRFKLKPA
eukprot:6491120-Amphidinium_carterae.1